jgi:uncharacterized membrane protein (UPF0127 family)
MYNQEKNNSVLKLEKYQTSCGTYDKGELTIGNKKIFVDIADNECKLSLGLSGKDSQLDTGMYFIFNKEGNYGFWMKDMNFPLDIVWINSKNLVVGIENSLATSTYPKAYGQKYFAQYVLEVPAGFCKKNNIKVGDRIIFAKI